MYRLRSASRWTAAAWLIGQVVLLSLSTAVLGWTPPRTAAAVVCECSGTPTARACPMHPAHAPAQSQAPDSQCHLRSCGTPDAGLVATSGAVGILPAIASLHPDRPFDRLATAQASPFHRADRPDSPPPRA